MMIFIKDGLPCLVTSQDSEAYLSSGTLEIDDDSRDYFTELQQEQNHTGQPLFLRMAADEVIPIENAHDLLRQYGNFFFASLWTHPEYRFAFFQMESLPDYCLIEPLAKPVENWLLETLRCVPAEDSVLQTIDHSLVPGFSRAGYDCLEKLSLDEQEVAFCQQVATESGRLELLSTALEMNPTELAHIVFRLQSLKIIDLWPAD
ncbi:MAG: hypothetical protein AAFY98_12125 [Verrucomicrobiota bacterium]